jgi:hypothetical protein
MAGTISARRAWVRNDSATTPFARRHEQALALPDGHAAADDHSLRIEDIDDRDERGSERPPGPAHDVGRDGIARLFGERHINSLQRVVHACSATRRPSGLSRSTLPVSTAARAWAAMPVPDTRASRCPRAPQRTAWPVDIDDQVARTRRRRRQAHASIARR